MDKQKLKQKRKWLFPVLLVIILSLMSWLMLINRELITKLQSEGKTAQTILPV